MFSVSHVRRFETAAFVNMMRVAPLSSQLSCFTKRRRFFCSHSQQETPATDVINMSEYKEKFAQRMQMAGLRPHHRIAMAVSGGPDSMDLCVLAARWKSTKFNGGNNFIDGLLAIVVDHGLREESAEEADLVRNRILKWVVLGIKCEVSKCEWLDGKPKLGQLQESARNKRYEILRDLCIQEKIGVLLVAHHADDQAELFILRLSRNSGVLGLAGMASTSELFPKFPDFGEEESRARGVLLVRPLLEFSKEDMYTICRGGNQQWVEDPTNRSQLFARNRIRYSLNTFTSSRFRGELQAVISACRRTRLHVDKLCRQLLDQIVTIMPHGYAAIDLFALRSMELNDIYLAKFGSVVLQFVSQRHRAIRGNALKLLLSYFLTSQCKTCLTLAGCYLCPAPGSKGTAVLVCCLVDSKLPLMMKLPHEYSSKSTEQSIKSELEQIVTQGRENEDKFASDASFVPFLEACSSDSVLVEAKRLDILSDSVHENIVALQNEESKNFLSKPKTASEVASKDDLRFSDLGTTRLICPGQSGYFMNRFILEWRVQNNDSYSTNESLSPKEQWLCCSCVVGDEMVAEVRHMIDTDWLYLSELSKKSGIPRSHRHSCDETEQLTGKLILCLDYAILSARQALSSLKSIPVAARRAMPVLVNVKGGLLMIPIIGFRHCPHLTVSARFSPRIPLDGAHSSFL